MVVVLFISVSVSGLVGAQDARLDVERLGGNRLELAIDMPSEWVGCTRLVDLTSAGAQQSVADAQEASALSAVG